MEKISFIINIPIGHSIGQIVFIYLILSDRIKVDNC